MRTLVADVGATNARFAIAEARPRAAPALHHVAILPCRQFASLEAAATAYLRKNAGGEHPRGATIAVAGPVGGDQVTLTNLNWSFSVAGMRRSLGLDALHLINDLSAVSLALDSLPPSALAPIGPPSANVTLTDAPSLAVIAPGSGLGMGGRVHSGTKPVALASEGGHANFAPSDEVDLAIFLTLLGKYGHVSNERVLSGPGLENIYEALAGIAGRAGNHQTAEDITRRGLAGEDNLCRDTLSRFAAILGSAAGDLALTLCAQAVFVAGGIAPRMVDFIRKSTFRSRFESKGRFASWLKSIPTFIITDPHVGLLGAAIDAAQG